MPVDYVKSEKVMLRDVGRNEGWVQDRIAEDPTILGLGDLRMMDRERRQPGAGRLDLLLLDENSDPPRRYEVELQLGASDSSHIIRTIEYWDIERKRYPQCDHCAVLVAEDITSRFLNVVSLFNGTIPIVAVQMQALKVEGKVTLTCIKVLDEMALGLVDEGEDSSPVDRSYWEGKFPESMQLVDRVFSEFRSLDSNLELNYKRRYIGICCSGQPHDFVSFSLRRKFIWFDVKIKESDVINQKIDEAGLDSPGYKNNKEYYPLRLYKGDFDDEGKRGVIRELACLAYESWRGRVVRRTWL